MKSASRSLLNHETDVRFWAQTGYKIGKPLDPAHVPADRPMAQVWRDIYAKVADEDRRGVLRVTHDDPKVVKNLDLAAKAAAATDDQIAKAATTQDPEAVERHLSLAARADRLSVLATRAAASRQPPTVSPVLVTVAAKRAAEETGVAPIPVKVSPQSPAVASTAARPRPVRDLPPADEPTHPAAAAARAPRVPSINFDEIREQARGLCPGVVARYAHLDPNTVDRDTARRMAEECLGEMNPLTAMVARAQVYDAIDEAFPRAPIAHTPVDDTRAARAPQLAVAVHEETPGASPVLRDQTSPAELAQIRDLAQQAAAAAPGQVVGVAIHDPEGPAAKVFASRESAAGWYGAIMAQHPYRYVAYFDKSDGAWPSPVEESLGDRPVNADTSARAPAAAPLAPASAVPSVPRGPSADTGKKSVLPTVLLGAGAALAAMALLGGKGTSS